MKQTRHQRAILVFFFYALTFTITDLARAGGIIQPKQGVASWYGEEHRGKLMANGHKFDPDKLTAASWFYPLGTRVRVTVSIPNFGSRSVMVTVTDRGPAKRFVEHGRIIDLAHAAFQKIAQPDLGLAGVIVEPVP
jgi:rare lipoprotein A